MFTIAVPNYQDGYALHDCLASIQAQTYEDWECLINDNQSTDDSVEIAQEFVGKDSRFKLFIAPNHTLGAQDGLNRCLIAHATGDLASWINADDAIMPNYLEELIPYFADPDVGFVRTGIYFYYESDFPMGHPGMKELKLAIPLPMDHPLENLRVNKIFCGSPFRRKWYIELGGMDEKARYWDWDFWIRMSIAVVERKFIYDTCMNAFIIRKIHGIEYFDDDAKIDKDAGAPYMMKKYSKKINALGCYRYAWDPRMDYNEAPNLVCPIGKRTHDTIVTAKDL